MDGAEIKVGTIVLIVIGMCISIGMYGCPQYNIYHQRLEGEAELAKAEYSRKVQIQDAQSKLEAAHSLAGAAIETAKGAAQAEIERAYGVAQANKIIGDSLKGNEDYLRYLWITNLEAGENREVIYVPSQGGLPILEAGKRK